MNTLSIESKRLLSLCVVAVTVCALVYQFVVVALHKERQSIKLETTQLQVKLLDYQTTMLTINSYLNKRKELSVRRQLLSIGLYNREEVLALVNALVAMASNEGARVREISPSVEEILELNNHAPGDESPQYLEMAVRVSGSLSSAGRFMKQLENSPLFVQLRKLTVIEREKGFVPADYTIRFNAILGSAPRSEMATK